MTLPPSGTATLTAIVVTLFSSGPSCEVDTPSTHAALPAVVSQTPPRPFCNWSAVIVRPPEALNVSVIVPSTAPSGASAVSPWPTLSRSLPLYVNVIVTGMLTVNPVTQRPAPPTRINHTRARPPGGGGPGDEKGC